MFVFLKSINLLSLTSLLMNSMCDFAQAPEPRILNHYFSAMFL